MTDKKSALAIVTVFIIAVLLISGFVHADSKKKNPDTGDVYELLWNSYQTSINKPQAQLHGTEYILGQVALPFVQLSYANGSLENTASCFIDIYSPVSPHNDIVEQVPMVALGEEGLYYYSFVPTLVGNHMMSSYCTLGSSNIPHTDKYTITTGTINGGSTSDLTVMDQNVLNLRPVSNTIVIQENITLTTSAINVSSIAIYSSLKRDTAATKLFSVCVWDYKNKNYKNCSTESITNEFVLLNANFATNSTGGNLLNSTTSNSGVVSIQINSSGGLGSADYFFDFLSAEIMANQNFTQVIRGGGEAHVSANWTLDINGNVTNIVNNTPILNAINAANTSLHTALSANYTSLNSSIYNANRTADLAWKSANQSSAYADLAAQYGLANYNWIQGVDSNLTSINTSLTGYILGVNASVYIAFNDSNSTPILLNITQQLVDIQNTTNTIETTTNNTYDLAVIINGKLTDLRAALDQTTGILLDLYDQTTGFIKKTGDSTFRFLFGK